jgi:hypothetical protein
MAPDFMLRLDVEEGVYDYTSVVELHIWFQAQVCFPNLYIVYY